MMAGCWTRGAGHRHMSVAARRAHPSTGRGSLMTQQDAGGPDQIMEGVREPRDAQAPRVRLQEVQRAAAERTPALDAEEGGAAGLRPAAVPSSPRSALQPLQGALARSRTPPPSRPPTAGWRLHHVRAEPSGDASAARWSLDAVRRAVGDPVLRKASWWRAAGVEPTRAGIVLPQSWPRWTTTPWPGCSSSPTTSGMPPSWRETHAEAESTTQSRARVIGVNTHNLKPSRWTWTRFGRLARRLPQARWSWRSRGIVARAQVRLYAGGPTPCWRGRRS
ncbi:hypothetical protein QJS66_02130 [Kocuria rhizophila]|nr:hypothetical protein QJS66_02130 [Kocuria rhizophila]